MCREFTFRYSCAGFQRLFSRKTVCDAMHRWCFGECARGKNKRSALKRKAEQNTRLIYLYNYSLAVGVWNTTAPYFRFSCSIKCVRFNPQIYPTVFHTPLALEINLIILVFICFLFLRLINNLPTFKRTSLIEISRETNSAHGGSRFKLTKRTKIDCSLLLRRYKFMSSCNTMQSKASLI